MTSDYNINHKIDVIGGDVTKLSVQLGKLKTSLDHLQTDVSEIKSLERLNSSTISTLAGIIAEQGSQIMSVNTQVQTLTTNFKDDLIPRRELERRFAEIDRLIGTIDKKFAYAIGLVGTVVLGVITFAAKKFLGIDIPFH